MTVTQGRVRLEESEGLVCSGCGKGSKVTVSSRVKRCNWALLSRFRRDEKSKLKPVTIKLPVEPRDGPSGGTHVSIRQNVAHRLGLYGHSRDKHAELPSSRSLLYHSTFLMKASELEVTSTPSTTLP